MYTFRELRAIDFGFAWKRTVDGVLPGRNLVWELMLAPVTMPLYFYCMIHTQVMVKRLIKSLEAANLIAKEILDRGKNV